MVVVVGVVVGVVVFVDVDGKRGRRRGRSDDERSGDSLLRTVLVVEIALGR